MTPTSTTNFTRAVEAHAMGDLLNAIRFLLLHLQEMKAQIRALENRAMGLPVAIEPPERNFTDGLDEPNLKEPDKDCRYCQGSGVADTPFGGIMVCSCRYEIPDLITALKNKNKPR